MSIRPEWDVVVLGGIATDFLARGADLPSPERPVQGSRFLVAPGGKGLNAAAAAARLGARVAMIGCVGADARGDELLAALEGEPVDVRHVRRVGDAETGATVVQVAGDGRKQTTGVPGANARLSPVDVAAADPLLRNTRTLVAQLEPPLEAVREAVERASAAGARVIVDPAPPRGLPDALLERVDVMKPNAGEAEFLTGIHPDDRSSAERVADALLARGVRVAIVEAGDGTLLKGSGESYWFPRLTVEVVDTTGAGDAFAAGLAVALAEGSDLRRAGWLAHAAAALTTTRLGALPALPTRAEVLRLLDHLARREPGSDDETRSPPYGR